MKRTSRSGSAQGPRRTAWCPGCIQLLKSIFLVLEKVLQNSEAGGPSAAHSIDCLTDKLDDGGEKEMYSVLPITPKAISTHLSSSSP